MDRMEAVQSMQGLEKGLKFVKFSVVLRNEQP